MEKHLESMLEELIGPPIVDITCLLNNVKIAEEEVTSMTQQYPLMRRALRKAFLALQPTPLVKLSKLYRAHCQELLRRVVKKEDLSDLTRAELLGVIAEASVGTPLNSTTTALYFRLFKALFPKEDHLFFDVESSFTLGDQGDVDELEEKIRRRMRPVVSQIEARKGV